MNSKLSPVLMPHELSFYLIAYALKEFSLDLGQFRAYRSKMKIILVLSPNKEILCLTPTPEVSILPV